MDKYLTDKQAYDAYVSEYNMYIVNLPSYKMYQTLIVNMEKHNFCDEDECGNTFVTKAHVKLFCTFIRQQPLPKSTQQRGIVQTRQAPAFKKHEKDVLVEGTAENTKTGKMYKNHARSVGFPPVAIRTLLGRK